MAYRFHITAILTIGAFVLLGAATDNYKDLPARRLEVLFLGHTSNQHHNSEKLASIFTKEYFKSGINITFTMDPADLNESNLAYYDALIVYANHDSISDSQAKALLNFVKSGKGFIPLHCASWSFRNNAEVVDLIGGQFKSHKYNSFPAVIVKQDHDVAQGIAPFVTEDETYVHSKLAKDIQVITERVEGDHHEPYTWVKSYGQGRVFYTAYGHDDKTFNNQGFLDLCRNGILWAAGDKAKENLQQLHIANPKYFEGPVPNYEKRNPAPLVQESLTPAQSMSLMQVPVGFELQLFAAEPDVVNPIYINWDERGRLWVIETVDYPNEIKSEDVGDDRIKILEDTDGDGKADKTTIFADKLNIPTSFVFSNGGIIVSMAPSFVFLKDTNNDDRADIRQNFLRGWGKRDTHAQASNLRTGVDNKIWGVVGYSGYYNGKKGKDSLSFGNGLYKFDPNSRQLEYLSSTTNNTWGLGFSEEFDVFVSTANNTHTAFFGMPKKYFDKARINETGVQKLDAHYDMRTATKNLRQVDVHGGFTAAAGHSLYTARSFPKSYWNSTAFVTEPTGRLVHRVNLKPDGAGFREDGDGWNMMASADEWAGPVQAEVGPDGALWITDWYDFIIQHNPTPTEASSGLKADNGPGNAYINPLRDHERGRIYRLYYKAADKKNTMKLSKSDPRGLIAALSNDNMFWRTTAQRLLVERKDKSVFPELYKIVQNEKLDEIGINAPAIHALWTLHGLQAFNGSNQQALAVAMKALTHPAAGVRRAAIQVLPKTAASFQAINKAGAFSDKDFRVRLAAVLATTEMTSSAEIGKALVGMAEKEENFSDMWLRHALTIASKLNEVHFKAAFRSRGLNDNPSLAEASLAQRLAFGSRLSDVPVRRSFGRQAADAPNPNLVNNEWLVSGDMQKPRPGPGGQNQPGANNNARSGQPVVYTGVILAHGDSKNGYGLYMQEDKLYFTVNQEGKAYQIVTPQTLPPQFSFKAGLQKNGVMKLLIDNKEVASIKTPGLFKKSLEIPMRVGFDNRKGEEKIANYPDTFLLTRGSGPSNAKLEILESLTAAATTAKIDKVIVLKVLKDVMKYDRELITAKAGTTIQIVLQNPDFMQHNLLVLKPNTMEKVGLAADKMVTDPNGAKMHYIPKLPEVIAATPMINPGGKYTLLVKLPNVPGDYPYICTFPGHWRIMKGILRVTK
jgi:putative membrane-bound dehydrogenase-like protein